jgi:hypothetical protein
MIQRKTLRLEKDGSSSSATRQTKIFNGSHHGGEVRLPEANEPQDDTRQGPQLGAARRAGRP